MVAQDWLYFARLIQENLKFKVSLGNKPGPCL